MDRHDEVLAWAAAARTRRDEIVADVTNARADLAAIVATRHEPLVGPIKLVVVVQAVPGVGKVAARRLLAQLDLEEHHIGELGDDQVAALLAAVEAARRPGLNVAGG